MKYKILSSMVMAMLAGGPLYATTDPALGSSRRQLLLSPPPWMNKGR